MCTVQRQVCETRRSSPRCRLIATLTASSLSFSPQDEISKATTSDELLLPETIMCDYARLKYSLAQQLDNLKMIVLMARDQIIIIKFLLSLFIFCYCY